MDNDLTHTGLLPSRKKERRKREKIDPESPRDIEAALDRTFQSELYKQDVARIRQSSAVLR